MEKQGQGAMDMIKKMGAQSSTGLLSNVIKEWKEVVEDEKQGAAVAEQLSQKASALASMASRSKNGAKSNSERMSELQDQQLVLFSFCFWKRDCQVERVKKYGRDRNKKREKELLGVKSLFRDFASRLDRTLDQDTTPRVEAAAAKPKRESPQLRNIYRGYTRRECAGPARGRRGRAGPRQQDARRPRRDGANAHPGRLRLPGVGQHRQRSQQRAGSHGGPCQRHLRR